MLAVSVRAVTHSPDVGIAQLRRMVAGAKALPSQPRVRGSVLLPLAEAQALRAAFGGPVPLPSTMAPGFIFTRSFVQHRSQYSPRTVYVWFERGGRKLQWTSLPRDTATTPPARAPARVIPLPR